ncbi:uncharacterized protein LOC135810663 [Sycon ciliatum]|uniref:uncharacterized protein LOC135810663 n=1 Tax=Sycon ciliatum TaxID=27933 RepID=UPI0031F6B26F
MSKAFDTVSRAKLLTVMEPIVGEDNIRLIRVLLCNTTLRIRLGTDMSSLFNTNVGTPQGDALSPVLFVVYLESALRDFRAAAPPRPLQDQHLPPEVIYADDTDFISSSRQWLTDIEPIAAEVLGEWYLRVNHDKTERTTFPREKVRIAEDWRSTRKLGSLIGDEQDVIRRKQLASAAYQSMFSLWRRSKQVSERVRLRLYTALIVPILLYNCGTWGLTAATEERLDSFHRRQLRSLIGVRWPQCISNINVYSRCGAEPISATVKRARWRLMGHVLRLPGDTPAVMAMKAYFVCREGSFRGRPRTTLVTTLSKDLEKKNMGKLKTAADLDSLRSTAASREEWRDFCRALY